MLVRLLVCYKFSCGWLHVYTVYVSCVCIICGVQMKKVYLMNCYVSLVIWYFIRFGCDAFFFYVC